MPAAAGPRGAARRAHRLHQVDHDRRANRKASGGCAARAAPLDRAYGPQSQFHGHRCGHRNSPTHLNSIVELQHLSHGIGMCSSEAAAGLAGPKRP